MNEKVKISRKVKITDAFWEIYKETPLDRITVKDIADAACISRGTFYNHFQDIYAVLGFIEEELSSSLNEACSHFSTSGGTLTDFLQIFHQSFRDTKTREYISVIVLDHRDTAFAENYLNKIRELLSAVCVDSHKELKSEKERIILDSALSSIITMLLNCICKAALSLEETNALVIGLLQNGYYITLTNRLGIDSFINPF